MRDTGSRDGVRSSEDYGSRERCSSSERRARSTSTPVHWSFRHSRKERALTPQGARKDSGLSDDPGATALPAGMGLGRGTGRPRPGAAEGGDRHDFHLAGAQSLLEFRVPRAHASARRHLHFSCRRAQRAGLPRAGDPRRMERGRAHTEGEGVAPQERFARPSVRSEGPRQAQPPRVTSLPALQPGPSRNPPLRGRTWGACASVARAGTDGPRRAWAGEQRPSPWRARSPSSAHS